MKTNKHVGAGGVRYDIGVAPASNGDADPELLAQLGKKPKIRITTMVDLDIYEALKRRAAIESDGRYQTYLNALLREVLIVDFGGGSITDMAKAIIVMREGMNALQARVDNLDRKYGTQKKKKKRA